jgi:hypothetical protein
MDLAPQEGAEIDLGRIDPPMIHSQPAFPERIGAARLKPQIVQ